MRGMRRHGGPAALVVLVALSAGPSGAQAADPSVTLDRTGTSAGETMLVTGAGWEPGASLIVELCGHGGIDGSIDCDVPHQKTAGVGTAGTFAVELTTGIPPTPCPCVVKVTDQSSRIAATGLIAVAGVPTVPITDVTPAARTLDITSMRITGGQSWLELFGAGGQRSLEIDLVNTGAVAVESPDLSIAWGSGSAPSGFVAPPEVGRMEPGQARTVTVALETPAFLIGDRTAVVEVQGLGEPVVVRTSMTSHPWGLLALGLVMLQLLLLRLRNRLRRRVHRGAAHLAPAGSAAPEARAVLALTAAEPDEPVVPSVVEVLDLDAEAAEEPAAPIDPFPAQVETHVVTDEPAPVPLPELPAEDPVDRASEPTPVTLDLTELERAAVEAVVPPTATGVVVNGSPRRVEEPLQTAARALQQAEAEASAIVEAARDRLSHLEAQAPVRMEEAEARCERALEVLDAVWRRAETLAKAAETAVTVARDETEADIHAAQQALIAAEAARSSRVEDARRELARVTESMAQGSRAATDAAAEDDTPAPSRAPRVDELDRRLARAVERALTSMGPGSTN